MAFRPDLRCKVCKIIVEEGDEKLLARLYKSSHFRGKKGEKQINILKAYEGRFHANGLWRHLKHHQALSEEDITKNAHDRITKAQTANLVKEVINHTTVRDLVITKGHKGIKSGRIKLNARDVLQATKQAADIEERQKDRSVQVMDMVFRFASGEMKPNADLTGGDNPPGRSFIPSST